MYLEQGAIRCAGWLLHEALALMMISLWVLPLDQIISVFRSTEGV
uniref:Uncharacterized protein n=1 Tax=Rhizophora mucronata TaxID=61149 RepID=A0A2P2PQ21_RHIMU